MVTDTLDSFTLDTFTPLHYISNTNIDLFLGRLSNNSVKIVLVDLLFYADASYLCHTPPGGGGWGGASNKYSKYSKLYSR